MNYWWDTRVSTEQQDLPAQRHGLRALGVGDDRIYVDHGLTGTNRARPGLRLALAACRAGDTLVVTKLDRLAARCPTLVTSGRADQAELAELFGVGRSTIYRTIERMRPKSIEPERPFAHRAIVAEQAISAPRKFQPTE